MTQRRLLQCAFEHLAAAFAALAASVAAGEKQSEEPMPPTKPPSDEDVN
jgi:hypothetical protein